jgi:hypothetical protein
MEPAEASITRPTGCSARRLAARERRRRSESR